MTQSRWFAATTITEDQREIRGPFSSDKERNAHWTKFHIETGYKFTGVGIDIIDDMPVLVKLTYYSREDLDELGLDPAEFGWE